MKLFLVVLNNRRNSFKPVLVVAKDKELAESSSRDDYWVEAFATEVTKVDGYNVNISKSEKVDYEGVLREVLHYEAYSWSNDRQFIDSRINSLLKKGEC